MNNDVKKFLEAHWEIKEALKTVPLDLSHSDRWGYIYDLIFDEFHIPHADLPEGLITTLTELSEEGRL